jgi:hypothetical protein
MRIASVAVCVALSIVVVTPANGQSNIAQSCSLAPLCL